MAEVLPSLLTFARRLRAAGVPASPAAVATYVRALALLPDLDLAGLYWAGRLALVSRREELPLYDREFRAFWLGEGEGAPPARAAPEGPGAPPAGRGGAEAEPAAAPFAGPGAAEAALWLLGWSGGRTADHGAAEEDVEDTPREGGARYSRAELLRTDAARLPPEALAAAAAAFRDLAVRPAFPSRRRRPGRRGRELDGRRLGRLLVRHLGEPVALPRRRRRRRPPRLVFLVDVSGSMAPYAGLVLPFVHAVARRGRATEVFLFGTRLTRVSRELRRSTVPALGERLPPDAGGGTRLGEALDAFATGLGRRGLAHGATLVVYSDGLDLGEAERVEAALARLRRLARRILWVNPLLGTAGYAPKARAMAAALPYLDRFLPGNTVASLLALAPVLFGEGNG